MRIASRTLDGASAAATGWTGLAGVLQDVGQQVTAKKDPSLDDDDAAAAAALAVRMIQMPRFRWRRVCHQSCPLDPCASCPGQACTSGRPLRCPFSRACACASRADRLSGARSRNCP